MLVDFKMISTIEYQFRLEMSFLFTAEMAGKLASPLLTIYFKRKITFVS